MTLAPGTVVLGEFYSDGRNGVGIVRARGRRLWTRCPEPYVPVEVIEGDRIRGGYRPEGLVPLPTLTEKGA